jgi:hypothetical protein
VPRFDSSNSAQYSRKHINDMVSQHIVSKRIKKTCARTLLIVGAILTTQTPTLAANLKNVCASYTAASKTIQLDISNGCVSSSAKYVGNDIKVDANEGWAIITLSGGFNYAKSNSKIVKHDCMGTKRLELSVAGVEPRRYSVMVASTYRGVFDFTKSHDRTCVTPSNPKGMSRVASIAERTELKKVLAKTEGATIQDIVAPLMRQLAISEEGRGTLSLDIEKTFVGDQNAPAAALAIIEAHGLGDDSVSGLHYQFRFVVTSKGWKATGVARKQMCARGKQAGKWTTANCS